MDYQNIQPAGKEIKVLGPGCRKCKTLEKVVRKALEKSESTASVTKVEDISEIMNYGVMTTPALVINEEVIFSGKVPSVKEMINIIQENN